MKKCSNEKEKCSNSKPCSCDITRVPVQIAVSSGNMLYALCSDGSMWKYVWVGFNDESWVKMIDIPKEK